jgi:multicomponent Na+:H+ antiporter subunit E
MDMEQSSASSAGGARPPAWSASSYAKGLVSRAHALTRQHPVQVRRLALGTAGVFVIWLLLVGSFDLQESAVGLIVAVLTAFVSLPHLAVLDGVKLSPALPWHVLRYLASFLRALLQSNLDMAGRVLSPSLPIRPAIVEVHTELQSDLGKLLLANSITLTPGTLSVDVHGDRLLVHWIDISPGADMVHATRAIAADFERLLREFLD